MILILTGEENSISAQLVRTKRRSKGTVLAKCSSHPLGRLALGGASAKETESNYPVKRVIRNPLAPNREKLPAANRSNRA